MLHRIGLGVTSYVRQKIPILADDFRRGCDTAKRAWRRLGSDVGRYRNILRLRSTYLTSEGNRMLSQLTGYEECEKLRQSVKTADSHFQRVKEELRRSRAEFDQAIQHRSQCQKELNVLLQRKQAWLDEDLMRFTELYRKEMRLEQAEVEARSINERLEGEVDAAHHALMDALRERYQEEQLWSDKIRRLSTFGTFSLMGFNVLLFLIIQLYVEPRKRRNTIMNFESLMDERLSTLQTTLSHEIALRPIPAVAETVQASPVPTERAVFVLPTAWIDAAKGAAAATAILIIGHVVASWV